MTRLGELFTELGALRQQLRKDAVSPGTTDEPRRKQPRAGRDVKVVHRKARGIVGQPKEHETRPRPARVRNSAAAPAARATPAVDPADRLWADASRLVIKASRANSLGSTAAAMDATSEGAVAVVGLDFGTAFTKAVVRFEGTDYAVEWEQAVALDGRDPYLLPTCFSECADGRILLGSLEAPDWVVRNGIKMALLQPDGETVSPEAIESAVLFVAAAFRHVQWWTRRHVPRAANAEIRWRLHLGVPSSADGTMLDLFLEVGRRAWRLAHTPGPVSRTGAAQAPSAETRGVTVLAELSAQMNAYHGSRQRQTDLHALLDFGAGTLDCVFFLDHQNQQDGDVIGVLDSSVEPFGIHRLLAALVGKRGEQHVWEDADAACSDEEIAAVTGDDVGTVSNRRSEYRQRVDGTFYKVWINSGKLYNVGPVHRQERPLRVFVVGGGSRNAWTRNSIDRLLERKFVREKRIGAYTLTDLPTPPTERFLYRGDAYHRMAVAHGLCEMQLNLGEYRTAADGAAVLARAPEIKERDEDR